MDKVELTVCGESPRRKRILFTPSDIVVFDFPGVTGIKLLIAQAQVENVTLRTTDDNLDGATATLTGMRRLPITAIVLILTK